MSVILGQGSTWPELPDRNARTSLDLNEFANDMWPPHASMSDARVAGVFSTHYPVEANGREIESVLSKNYTDDLYYRVHIFPTTINFGNVVSEQSRDVELWNATFEMQYLSQLSLGGAVGVELSETEIPMVLTPLQELVFQATASLNGPPTIDETLTAVIGDRTITVPVTGRRIIVFPFPPNWKNGVEDTFAFNSWVQRGSNGTVQTGSTWGNNPRRELDYTILLKGNDTARCENLLMGWQSRYYGVIQWPDESKLTAQCNIGAQTIYLDTTNRAFGVGSFVIIYKDSTHFEAAEIEEMTDDSITITTEFGTTWPVGSRVYPVFAGLINSSLQGVRHTDDVLEMPVSFESEPSVTVGNTDYVAPAATYQGYELYLGRLNWASALEFQFDSDRVTLDFGVGRTRSGSGSGYTPQTKKHNWFFKRRSDAREFREWLGRREGVAVPVYMPTGNTDLVLIADPLMGQLSIDVADNEYGDLLGAHPARRDIILIMRDGSYHARRIVSTSAISGGTRLALDAEWTANIDRTAVKRVSFLGLFRQVANKSTISWRTAEVGTAEMMLITDRND